MDGEGERFTQPYELAGPDVTIHTEDAKQI